jgi:hypothetical protein
MTPPRGVESFFYYGSAGRFALNAARANASSSAIKWRWPGIFLDELSNSHPAVRLYGEGSVTGPPKATGGAEIAAGSIDHLSRYIEMLFTAPAKSKRIVTWNGDAT